MQPDKVIADIIQTDMNIPAGRIVVNIQNWQPPDDDGLYIIIVSGNFTPVSVINIFDPNTNEEIKTVTGYQNITVILTSKNRDAVTRKEEVLMAIKSTYSTRVQENNEITINRGGDILDLSFVEGASGLNRENIPLRVQYKKQKRTVIEPIDKFRDPEVSTK